MQHSKTLDLLVGLFVASGTVALFFLALQVSNLSSFGKNEGYLVTAKFENSGGLKVKSSVSIAGVRIGRVSAIRFDNETFESIVEIHIESKYNTLPEDTSASIFTAGLLGEQYIGLAPGGAEEVLKNGSEIEFTQSALILEQLISQFLFNSNSEQE